MVPRRSLRVLPLVLGLLLSTGAGRIEAQSDPPGGGMAVEVPPIDVVVALRRARIAEDAGDIADARLLLDTIARKHPKEVLPLIRLVAFHDAHDTGYEGLPSLRARLTERLADPALPLPARSLRYLVQERSLGVEQLAVLEKRFVQRLATTEFLAAEEVELRDALDVLYQRTDDLEKQRENLGRILQIEPTFRTRWTALGLDLRMERWEDALALVEQMASEPNPAIAVPRIRLGLLAQLGRTEALLEALDAPDTDAALDAELLYTVAWALEDAGESAGAESVWRRLVELDPEDAAAREALLYLHGSLEEQRALAAAEASHWQAEEDPDALLERGTELLTTGDAAAALPLLERAAPHHPDSEMAWYNLGLAAQKLERWELVAEAFGRAAELNAQRVESFFNLGIALYELERCEEALAPLERTLELDPSRYQAHYYRGGCLGVLGRQDEAALEMVKYRAARDGS